MTLQCNCIPSSNVVVDPFRQVGQPLVDLLAHFRPHLMTELMPCPGPGCVLFASSAGLNEVDYSHYPDKSLQQEWLRAYLEAYKEHKGQGGPVTDREVEVLYVQANRFTLVRGPEAQPQSLTLTWAIG